MTTWPWWSMGGALLSAVPERYRPPGVTVSDPPPARPVPTTPRSPLSEREQTSDIWDDVKAGVRALPRRPPTAMVLAHRQAHRIDQAKTLAAADDEYRAEQLEVERREGTGWRS